MRVLINPTMAESGSGLTATATWDNPDMIAALHQLFRVDPKREKLVQVEVSQNGIVARMEHVPSR